MGKESGTVSTGMRMYTSPRGKYAYSPVSTVTPASITTQTWALSLSNLVDPWRGVSEAVPGLGSDLPAGISPNIGIGGHVLGGAFGYLCQQHRLAADHLYGVEVVVVDETGTAKSVVATLELSDPERDLWWAHTGGGGGNFGIVTWYWFRSPEALGTDPARPSPTAPPRRCGSKRSGTGKVSTKRPQPNGNRFLRCRARPAGQSHRTKRGA